MSTEGGKRTRRSAVEEAIGQHGEGWLLPVALWLAGGAGLGIGAYTITGVYGVFVAETVYGGVSGVILGIRRAGSAVDSEKTEVWVPLDRDEDD